MNCEVLYARVKRCLGGIWRPYFEQLIAEGHESRRNNTEGRDEITESILYNRTRRVASETFSLGKSKIRFELLYIGKD